MRYERKTKNFKPNITYVKILKCVYSLNKKHSYPNSDGVEQILNGILTKENKEFSEIDTFSTLLSVNGRKLRSHILMLIRYEYLRYKYDNDSSEPFLEITLKGKEFVSDYEKNHKLNLKKKIKTEKQTILKLIDIEKD